MTAETSKTITEIVLDISGAEGFDHDGGDFDILREALIATNLADVTADPMADFTVFAPTDAAFGELARSLGFTGDVAAEDHVLSFLIHATGFSSADHPGLLDDILLYHVAPEARTVEALEEDETIETAAGLTLTVDDGELIDNDPDLEDPEFIEGATDIEAENGIIQAIDRVLLPVDLDEAIAQPTIADIVVATSGASGFDHDGGDFDILREALGATDLLGVVADPTADFTVFAPTDAAFGDLAVSLGFDGDVSNEGHVFAFLAEATGFVSADEPGLLDDILLYHVAPEGRSVEALNADGVIDTAGGSALTVAGDQVIDAEPDLDNPEFISGATDIEAANGVVQAINGVLLPLDLEEAVADPVITDIVVAVSGEDGFDDHGGDFDLLREALEATGLDAVVSDPDADFTVFAPTDAAFGALAETLGFEGETSNEADVFGFLAEATGFESADEPGLLDDILLYHVAPGAQSLSELQHAEEIETAFGDIVTIAGHELVDNDPDIANPEFINSLTDIDTANGVIQAIDGVLLPVDLDEPVPEASIVGTAAAEAVSGTAGADTIFGDGGDDQVMGFDGDDLVMGGEGDDTLYAGINDAGADTLEGGAGDDLILGFSGEDEAFGQGGSDTLDGGADDDSLFGGDGDDFLYGRSGADLLEGGAGDDELSGNQDSDTLIGGAGDDSIYAQFGDDFADGGFGDDLIFGGLDDGSDTLAGGAGDDTLYGLDGDDTFIFGAGDGVDTVKDFTSGSDALDLSGLGEDYDTVEEILAAGAQDGGNAVFTFGEDQLILEGVTLAAISAEDLVLA